MTKKPTMNDIARLAEVSQATVSTVLNGKLNGKIKVSEDTQRRVLEAADKLNYRVNIVARALATGTYGCLELIIPDITDPYFPEFVSGVELSAQKHGYKIFLHNTLYSPSDELETIRYWSNRTVDGFIVCGTSLPTELLEKLAQQYKIVIVNERRIRGVGEVFIEEAEAILETIGLLRELGHRRIAFLSGPPQLYSSRMRLKAFRDGMSHHALNLSPHQLFYADDLTIDGGYRSGDSVLGAPFDFTALLCMNDQLAIGLLRALLEKGIAVPGDLSVIGFDDIPMASLISPALTTLMIPKREIGQKAVEMVVDMVANPDKPPPRVNIRPTLVERQTHGRPKGR